jgi:hypothetical protein
VTQIKPVTLGWVVRNKAGTALANDLGGQEIRAAIYATRERAELCRSRLNEPELWEARQWFAADLEDNNGTVEGNP